MLETAVATEFELGSNLRDSAAGAGWSFVLPSLQLERLICLGAPSEATLSTLTRLARSIVIWCPDRRHRRRLLALVEKRGWAHVAVEATLPEPPRSPEDGFDLVCLSPDAVRSLRGGDGLRLVPALLRPDGHAYLDLSGRAARRMGRILVDGLARDGFSEARWLWQTPQRGEVRAAAPAAFPDVTRYLVDHDLHRPSSPGGLVDRVVRLVGGTHARTHPTHRAGVVVGAAGAAGGGEVPRYVADLAHEAGIDLSGYRWGLSARGRYNSRKAVFVLFGGTGSPEYVVKMTRDPRLNHRLENEHRALTLLRRDNFGEADTYPQARFFGYHGGLAILGQNALGGEAFERRITGADGCPYPGAAAGWLTELAAATAQPAPPGPGVDDALGRLLESYGRLYAPGPDERAFLAEQVAALGSVPFPAVFQHGDPGTWNLLVTPTDRVAFLDWEAAEPHGLPLWDLFHFFRSYGMLASRRAGIRDPHDGFVRQFLSDTPVSRVLAQSLELYLSRLSLPADLIGPLFVTGWMHRALKEATRLTADRLAQGHYVRLLRLSISERHDPYLRRLLSTPR
ncbi:MAG: phosphotransferase [Acidimicrobiia bacterium]